MKKIVFILSSIVVCLSSCQDKTTYTLKGNVDGVADGTKVYLYENLYRTVITDSTTIKDNQFIFEGKLEKSIMRTLKVEGFGTQREGVAYVSSLISLEPGNRIELTIDKNGYYTKENSSFSSLMKKHMAFWSDLGATGAPDEESLLEMIKENKDNAIGTFYFANLLELAHPESKELKAFYPLFADKRGEDKRLDEMLDYINNLDNIAGIGTKYADIKGNTLDGREIAISDYVEKKDAVLLHFWMWTKNAEEDISYLVDAYTKYKDKNFEIVDIWLDEPSKDWRESVNNKYNMNWPQMECNKSIDQLIKTYALFDQPFTILIDKDGTIVDRGISGAELDKKLDELLK